jgi:hypothetical protein
MKARFRIKVNCFVGFSNYAPGDIIELEKEDGLRKKATMEIIEDIPEKGEDASNQDVTGKTTFSGKDKYKNKQVTKKIFKRK